MKVHRESKSEKVYCNLEQKHMHFPCAFLLFSFIVHKTEITNYYKNSDISGSHGGEYEDDSFLGCSAVQSR
jgi:hypothetical protein